MLCTRFLRFFVLAVVGLSGFWICGCARPGPPLIEEPPPVQEPAASPAPIQEETAQTVKLSPPKPAEIEAAVKRVFDDAAHVDKARNPSFVIGDFNGDSSEDIGVALKAAPGKLEQLNQEFPKWLTRDPLSEVLPRPVVVNDQDPKQTTPVVDRAGIRQMPILQDDTLLAVIHGHGPAGWRDPEATQTYLLKNVLGPGMQVQTRTQVATEGKGRQMPRIDGDVISQTLLGRAGFLYYSGATYRWYDPKYYKPEAPRMMVHGGQRPRADAQGK